MIKIKNISKHFGGIKALDNCTLNIPSRKITGVIGPNGSGKTTLFNIISQLIHEDKGEIYLEGEKINNKKDFEISKLGISRTFQEVKLFKNMTIGEHLKIAISENDEKLLKSFFGKEDIKIKKMKEVLEFVGLKESLNTLSTNLSYGQRKLLDLAIAILKPHKILLLDEPVAGVNPFLRNKIKNILKKLAKNGETILIIEHNMNFLMSLVDSIYVLNEGKVLTHGKPEQIQKNKKVLEAYLGN